MRARWVIVIVGVCLLAMVAAIAYGAGRRSVPEVIRARKFELVDAKGVVRASVLLAEVPLSDGDQPSVVLLDRSGVPRADLTLVGYGTPSLTFRGEKGEALVSLAPNPEREGTGLVFRDPKGSALVHLYSTSRGAALSLRNSNGESEAKVLLTADDLGPAVSLFDKDGGARTVIRLHEDGSPALSLSDTDGKVIWEAP